MLTSRHSERGLGAIIAKKFAIEGSNVAIHYNASAERAKRVAENIEKEYKVKAVVIQGVCRPDITPRTAFDVLSRIPAFSKTVKGWCRKPQMG